MPRRDLLPVETVRGMRSTKKATRTFDAVEEAAAVLDRDWLAAGLEPGELGQTEEVAALFDRLVAAGRPPEILIAEWQGKSAAEILARERDPADRASPAPGMPLGRAS